MVKWSSGHRLNIHCAFNRCVASFFVCHLKFSRGVQGKGEKMMSCRCHNGLHQAETRKIEMINLECSELRIEINDIHVLI